MPAAKPCHSHHKRRPSNGAGEVSPGLRGEPTGMQLLLGGFELVSLLNPFYLFVATAAAVYSIRGPWSSLRSILRVARIGVNLGSYGRATRQRDVSCGATKHSTNSTASRKRGAGDQRLFGCGRAVCSKLKLRRSDIELLQTLTFDILAWQRKMLISSEKKKQHRRDIREPPNLTLSSLLILVEEDTRGLPPSGLGWETRKVADRGNARWELANCTQTPVANERTRVPVAAKNFHVWLDSGMSYGDCVEPAASSS